MRFITNGFQRVIIFNRHLHRAEGLIRHFGRSAVAHGAARDAVARVGDRGGAGQDQDPGQRLGAVRCGHAVAHSRPSCSPPDLLVLDLMYQPRETKLMRDAKAAGATEVMNGDLMLLHQTAAAFNLWTGRDVALDFVQKRLDEVRDQQPAIQAATATD